MPNYSHWRGKEIRHKISNGYDKRRVAEVEYNFVAPNLLASLHGIISQDKSCKTIRAKMCSIPLMSRDLGRSVLWIYKPLEAANESRVGKSRRPFAFVGLQYLKSCTSSYI